MSRNEEIYAMSGDILDVLTDAVAEECDHTDLDKMGTELAKRLYDMLLPPKRAILTDKDGNIIGSVDLIGVARLGLKSELDWQQAVYKIFGLDK